MKLSLLHSETQYSPEGRGQPATSPRHRRCLVQPSPSLPKTGLHPSIKLKFKLSTIQAELGGVVGRGGIKKKPPLYAELCNSAACRISSSALPRLFAGLARLAPWNWQAQPRHLALHRHLGGWEEEEDGERLAARQPSPAQGTLQHRSCTGTEIAHSAVCAIGCLAGLMVVTTERC